VSVVTLSDRWLFRCAGSRVSEECREIRKAESPNCRPFRAQGHLLAPFARILLAIAYVHEKELPRARELLVGLQREFPNNSLFGRELARLDKGAGH
jgi:hypothetical protein